MASGDPTRVASVGLGGIARAQHVPGYLMRDGVEIAALCGVNEVAPGGVAQQRYDVERSVRYCREGLGMSEEPCGHERGPSAAAGIG